MWGILWSIIFRRGRSQPPSRYIKNGMIFPWYSHEIPYITPYIFHIRCGDVPGNLDKLPLWSRYLRHVYVDFVMDTKGVCERMRPRCLVKAMRKVASPLFFSSERCESELAKAVSIRWNTPGRGGRQDGSLPLYGRALSPYFSSAWWFGTLILFFHIMGIIIPTNFHIFQRDWNHQPVLHC